MALRNILTVEEPVLHKTARPVTRFDAHLGELLDDMRQTLTNAGGVGLAAPQIGILRRVVVVDDDGELIELVNPEILETSGEQDGMEGCLSVPGRYGMVKRPEFLAPNMVFCVDVGVYNEEWGIGFRLEDNCLITEDGCENLSAAIPRTIEDIEAVMRGDA